MADRRYGTPTPVAHDEIVHEDWAGRTLDGETHERIAYIDLDLSDVVNRGSVFTECTFRATRFNTSQHIGAAFVNCTFTRCSFFDAGFESCKLTGSMFDNCTFGAVVVTGGDWSFVGLPGADLRKASFTGTRMREADLTGARCQGATLRGLDLSGAWLASADLSGAELRGSDLSALDPLVTELRGAVIDVGQAVVLAGGMGLEVRPDED
jgi:fluoroquinolone resistance protein